MSRLVLNCARAAPLREVRQPLTFYWVAFRKKLYATLEELRADLDAWLRDYNEARPHQGRWCFGKTPMQTFLDSLPLAR